MPWKETSVMNERVRFISDWMEECYTMTELCDYYGISRKTGYKWVARYEAHGVQALEDVSRRPHSHPKQVKPALKQRIIRTKLLHQRWGPKKVMDYLRRTEPHRVWPADSTAGEILKRAGLVTPRKPKRRVSADGQPFKSCDRANRIWSADFKGHFRLGNGQRCYPLTITDNYSRYLLRCQGCARPGYDDVQPWFERTFREYGLPDAMRTDNGAPFASMGIGGISRLSAWWVQLGIKPERIKPGRPDQNGRHERFHRTLKAATTQPPSQDMVTQQQAFQQFTQEYNELRSHEALGRQTPAEHYQPSLRAYPDRLPNIEYDEHYLVRSVRQNGEIKWKGNHYWLTQVLTHQHVGIKQVDEHQWNVYFSFYHLGTLDEKQRKIIPPKQWHGQ